MDDVKENPCDCGDATNIIINAAETTHGSGSDGSNETIPYFFLFLHACNRNTAQLLARLRSAGCYCSDACSVVVLGLLLLRRRNCVVGVGVWIRIVWLFACWLDLWFYLRRVTSGKIGRRAPLQNIFSGSQKIVRFGSQTSSELD